MAQLRDAQTSELIAEGTPEEIAQVAADFDPADVLFDDVGAVNQAGVSLFDPTVVTKATDDEIAHLESAIADPAVNGKAELRAAVKRHRDRVEAARARRPAAKAALKAARDRVRARGGR